MPCSRAAAPLAIAALAFACGRRDEPAGPPAPAPAATNGAAACGEPRRGVTPEERLRLHLGVLEHPGDRERLCAYLRTLPVFEGRFVLEGDLLVTEDEARAVLDRSERARGEPGAPPLRGSPEQRTFVAVVDAASFWRGGRSAADLTKWLEQAGSDWTALCRGCGVRFVSGTLDREGSVHFLVRYAPAGLEGLPALVSVPPEAEARPVLWILPPLFSDPERSTGLLRHALGHVLGHLHDQTGSPGVCVEAGPGEWRRLLEEEPTSVLRYACGPRDSRAAEFSRADCVAHHERHGRSGAAGCR